MVFKFLYTVIDILKAYFADEPTEDLIKSKYVLIYELLDEIIDYGIPQITEAHVTHTNLDLINQALKEFIVEGDLKLEILSDFDRLKKLTTMVTGATGKVSMKLIYMNSLET